jgi:hypothetical protein
MSDQPQLLFVYNADSGLFNTVADIAHKIFAPQTYACDLCALTHGYFTERDAWRGFIEALGVPCEFLHRDQTQALPELAGQAFPAVFRRGADGWQPCLGPADIAACADLAALQQRIRTACL